MSEKTNRILFIGAHPDDSEVLFAGTARKLVKAGHVVKFVSVTNGDTGHFSMSREETVKRRYAEAQASAAKGGIVEYEILPHNCGLESSVENRCEIMRVIRRFNPDLVISHRLCDYHPDHRATAQLVQDCAYVVMVPHFCEDIPVPAQVPIFAYARDQFTEPRPHRPDAVVEIDSVLEEKLAMMNCHVSQFYEWLPWIDREKIPDYSNMSWDEKKNHLMKWVKLRQTVPDELRMWLKHIYGEERGSQIRYAETFEQSVYSRQVSREEFQKLLDPDACINGSKGTL